MYFDIQQCWADPLQHHSLVVAGLVIASNSVVFFVFSAICHMLWWQWFTRRQREASAYAFLVVVVFNSCLWLKYLFPSPRPHSGCGSATEMLFGAIINNSWPSMHVVVVVYMGLFYIHWWWIRMFPYTSTQNTTNNDDLEQGESQDSQDTQDTQFVEIETSTLGHLDLKTLINNLKGVNTNARSGFKHHLVHYEDEWERVKKWEGLLRIIVVLCYVYIVAASRILLELNHITDVWNGVVLGIVFYSMFCITYTQLANRLTTRATAMGEKIE